MKIRLLNDGGYDELSSVPYPFEVEASPVGGIFGFDVHAGQFRRFGLAVDGDPQYDYPGYYYFSLRRNECEVVK